MYESAVLDACVLFKSNLRRVLLELSYNKLFHARWSQTIEQELFKNLNRVYPNKSSIYWESLKENMREYIFDWEVEENVEFEKKLKMKDRHVLSIAANSRSNLFESALEYVVSVNKKPPLSVDELIEVIDKDDCAGFKELYCEL